MKTIYVIVFVLVCSRHLAGEEWSLVPQRRPPATPPRMCWVTHREPGQYETRDGGLTCGPWRLEADGVWRQRCVHTTYRRWVPARTYQRWEPCPKRHILDDEQEQSNGVVIDPDEHPIESRDRGVFPSRRTRTTPTCE